MPSISSVTARRLRHATGYMGLGMLNEALEELEAIEGEDRLTAEVMSVRCDFYLLAKQWDLLVAVARKSAHLLPGETMGWVHWAFALREMERVPEAKAVLLKAEPLHGEKCATLHYNLACYHCLLGELEDAKARLSRACQMDAKFKADALDDPDLKALWKSWNPAEPGV